MKHAHVTLADSGTRRLVWTGSLKEFFGANEIDRTERHAVCDTLRKGGTYHFGGGAAPGWTLAKVGAHVATLAVAALVLVGCAPDATPETRPAAPTGLVTIKDDAPAWCLDPDYPRGDMWYENCAEPLTRADAPAWCTELDIDRTTIAWQRLCGPERP